MKAVLLLLSLVVTAWPLSSDVPFPSELEIDRI